MSQLRMIWRWWAKSLGQKAIDNDNEADKVAIIRTLIFATYLVTNAFIIAGVVRHWNDQQPIHIEIHENSNNPKNSHTEGWYNLGVDGNTRIEGVYRSGEIKNRTGEFE